MKSPYLQYIWEAPGTTEFSLADFASVSAKILGGSMRGGKTYTVKLVATVSDDTDITTEATLTITTASKDLIPIISR